MLSKKPAYYALDKKSVVIDDEAATIAGTLSTWHVSNDDIAVELDMTLTFYQNGIMRALFEEPNSRRFRISQEGLPVVDEQLHTVENLTRKSQVTDDHIEVSGLDHQLGDETFTYRIWFDHFKIEQIDKDGDVTMVINPKDTLYVEHQNASKLQMYLSEEDETGYEWPGQVKEGVGLGFFVPTKNLFGLGEREDTLNLKTTSDRSPYQLFATDKPHHPDNPCPLYGSVPFIHGVSTDKSAGLAWVNSAHTWVYIHDDTYDSAEGSHISFVSESGALELFVFASAAPSGAEMNHAKRVNNAISTISGFAPLPQL